MKRRFIPTALDAFLHDGEKPKTSKPGEWYLRLKPYDRRAGHLLRSLTIYINGKPQRLSHNDSWKKLLRPTTETLLRLANLRNEPGDEYAAFALDICTYEEAKRMEVEDKLIAERLRGGRQIGVDDAGVLRSEDLPSTREERERARRENMRAVREAAENDAVAREERRKLAMAERAAEEKERLRAEREALARELAEEGVDLDDDDDEFADSADDSNEFEDDADSSENASALE